MLLERGCVHIIHRKFNYFRIYCITADELLMQCMWLGLLCILFVRYVSNYIIFLGIFWMWYIVPWLVAHSVRYGLRTGFLIQISVMFVMCPKNRKRWTYGIQEGQLRSRTPDKLSLVTLCYSGSSRFFMSIFGSSLTHSKSGKFDAVMNMLEWLSTGFNIATLLSY
jgi:hypothetical protein